MIFLEKQSMIFKNKISPARELTYTTAFNRQHAHNLYFVHYWVELIRIYHSNHAECYSKSCFWVQ